MKHAFVLLPVTLDVEAWQKRYASGEAPDLTPYGYHNAERYGCRVTFGNTTMKHGTELGLMPKMLLRILQFDVAHAWHNRALIRRSRPDTLWTYTEHEFLALLLLRRFGLIPKIPIIAQSIWLADVWPALGSARRALFTWLMKSAEVCSFNSPTNAAFARARRWGRSVELVDFGVSSESFPMQAPKVRRAVDKIRVLAIGNDRHRDWPLVHKAFGQLPQFEVRVAARTYPDALLCDNITKIFGSQSEVRGFYEWADVVIIPLLDNLHASGITVAFEAISLGKPVVATDIGGLSHYFGPDHIRYVPLGAADAMRAAVLDTMADPERCEARCRAAQQRFTDQDYTTVAYARRHVELAERLLSVDGR